MPVKRNTPFARLLSPEFYRAEIPAMEAIGKLFGVKKPEGPSEAEKALQAERQQQANRAEAEADQNVALASRASSLRKALAFRDEGKKGSLGG